MMPRRWPVLSEPFETGFPGEPVRPVRALSMFLTRTALFHHGLFDPATLRGRVPESAAGRARQVTEALRDRPAPSSGGGFAAVRRLGEALGLRLEVGDDRLSWLPMAGDGQPILLLMRPVGAPLSGVERDEWLRGALLSPPVQLWRRLRESGLPWGVVTDGHVLRLQHRDAPPDHHVTLDPSAALAAGDEETLALLAALFAGRHGETWWRDRCWLADRRRWGRTAGVVGRLLRQRRATPGEVSPLERWCFLAWLGGQPGGEEVAAALADWVESAKGRLPASLVRRVTALGWSAAGAKALLAPLAGWLRGGGAAEVAELCERLGEDAALAIASLDGLSFARLWEGPGRAAEVAQDGAFWRLAGTGVAEAGPALTRIHEEVLHRLGKVQGQVDHGPVASEVREHFAGALDRQRAHLAGLSVLDLTPRRGMRLAVWVEQTLEAVLASPGYTSPWLEAGVDGEVDGLRALVRECLSAVVPASADPAAVAVPLAAVAPNVPWSTLERHVVSGDWLGASALLDLAQPLASRRAKAGQTDLFDHVFHEQLSMLRADFRLLAHGRADAELPASLLRTEERVRLGADVVNAWLAGEDVPWSGVEQVVAQIRGAGSDSDLTKAPWCRRARHWAAARGLVYLELAFPERLLEDGRPGFAVVVGGVAPGKRVGRESRRRVHDLLAPGGTACWVAECGGAQRLDALRGADKVALPCDETARITMWRRRRDDGLSDR